MGKYTLAKEVNGKLMFIKDYAEGSIELTEKRSEAMRFSDRHKVKRLMMLYDGLEVEYLTNEEILKMQEDVVNLINSKEGNYLFDKIDAAAKELGLSVPEFVCSGFPASKKQVKRLREESACNIKAEYSMATEYYVKSLTGTKFAFFVIEVNADEVHLFAEDNNGNRWSIAYTSASELTSVLCVDTATVDNMCKMSAIYSFIHPDIAFAFFQYLKYVKLRSATVSVG